MNLHRKGNKVHIDQYSTEELQRQLSVSEDAYRTLREAGLALDLTRGKPSAAQVALSDSLDGILAGNYLAANGVDVRNYGGLEGLAEARELFGGLLGAPAQETLVGGNASLTLMYDTVDLALNIGLRGPGSAWCENLETVKFLCPAPGYDRHFAICEHLGIEMITVPMLDTGPDMDRVDALVEEDRAIKGMWCIPRFSNPTGCVYSDSTVERIAQLGNIASENFLVLWDNAYAVHTLYNKAPQLASIRTFCEKFDTLDNVVQFGSTSKITYAGAGVSFLATSEDNLENYAKHLGIRTIGPDKVNQLRHVQLFPNAQAIDDHMARHAALIAPKFDAVVATLERELGDTGMGRWLTPSGGYFISFDTLPGLAQEVVNLAAEIGVKLTPAGATFPYGNDPTDTNIRLAPTFPEPEDVQAAVDAFVICVKLATLRSRLN